MLEARRSQANPSHVLVLRNVLCVVLGVGVLWSLVHSGYELTACLHALRVYSLLVVALEGVCRYASAPAALPDASKGRTKRQARVRHGAG